jgi:hypothetical protein
MTQSLLDPRTINRSNLREAIRYALQHARSVHAATGQSNTDARYTELAVTTLELIASRLDLPKEQRKPIGAAFGAVVVREEPTVDDYLYRLVTKIEDVYRRWHHTVV